MHSWKMLVCCSGHLKQTHVDWDWCNLMQKVFCIICVGMGNNGKEERNCEMLTLCTCFLQLKIFFYGFGSLCPLSWHFFFFPFIAKCTQLFFSSYWLEGRKRGFVPYKILCLPGIPTCNKAPFMLLQLSERTFTRYPIKNLLCCQWKCKEAVDIWGSTLIYSTMKWRK